MQSQDVAESGQPLQKCLRDPPQPGPDEVLSRLGHCAVCHSDVHIDEGGCGRWRKRKLLLRDQAAGRIIGRAVLDTT